MEKILVEIKVPAASAKYDVFIPKTLKMYDIIRIVSKMMSELTKGKYQYDPFAVICDAESGNILDINLYVYESGLKNGSKLILM